MGFMEMGRSLGAGPTPTPRRRRILVRPVRPPGYRDGSFQIPTPQPSNWHDVAFPVVSVEHWTPYAGFAAPVPGSSMERF